MRGKLHIVNAAMGLMILLAILFQSAHSFHHLANQLSKKYCHHIYHDHQAELHHGHGGLEKCFTCEFAFSHTTKADGNSYSFVNKFFNTKTIFGYCSETILFFKGSSFLLRGPPTVSSLLT